MTINFSNQYEVGFFSPPSGSTTTTTSTCYTLSSSSTPTSSTTNVFTSKVNKTLARGMLLSSQLQGTECNGGCSHFVQSRARCRTPPPQPSVTCLGERGISSAAATTLGIMGAASAGLPQHQHATSSQQRLDPPQPTAIIQKMDTWTESFQDLQSWCHPDQDELNTPQITMQDEFNFSPDGQVNNCNWGCVQSQVEINDQLLNQELLLASPSNIFTEEENNNYTIIDIQGNIAPYLQPNLSKGSLGKVMEYNASEVVMTGAGSSALKAKGHDVLLTQAIPLDESPPVIVGEQLMGGGFFDIKLNSSQIPMVATRLGSGGKLIMKAEEPRLPEVGEEWEVVQPQSLVQPSRRVGKPTRPKLKLLDIPQPATTTSAATSLATPDVLKPLTDISSSDFNLLEYVCEGGEDSRTLPISSKEVSLQDHNYTETIEDEKVHIKCEPMSPVANDVLPAHTTSRKRTFSNADDEDYYDSDIETKSFVGGDSGEEEWAPSESGRRVGKRRGRKPSSSADSFDGPDRYRALRDRNNEASRRSRQNRKQRDLEIRHHKTDLEKRNAVLKVKADRMEALVKHMRAALLQSIKNSRKASNHA